MTFTFQATGSEIFALAKRIEDEGGHANAFHYLKNPWGGYSSTMEITATFPDQPELSCFSTNKITPASNPTKP
jgi:hypothetical protein